jgi:hypothetical protein
MSDSDYEDDTNEEDQTVNAFTFTLLSKFKDSIKVGVQAASARDEGTCPLTCANHRPTMTRSRDYSKPLRHHSRGELDGLERMNGSAVSSHARSRRPSRVSSL